MNRQCDCDRLVINRVCDSELRVGVSSLLCDGKPRQAAEAGAVSKIVMFDCYKCDLRSVVFIAATYGGGSVFGYILHHPTSETVLRVDEFDEHSLSSFPAF